MGVIYPQSGFAKSHLQLSAEFDSSFCDIVTK